MLNSLGNKMKDNKKIFNSVGHVSIVDESKYKYFKPYVNQDDYPWGRPPETGTTIDFILSYDSRLTNNPFGSTTPEQRKEAYLYALTIPELEAGYDDIADIIINIFAGLDWNNTISAFVDLNSVTTPTKINVSASTLLMANMAFLYQANDPTQVTNTDYASICNGNTDAFITWVDKLKPYWTDYIESVLQSLSIYFDGVKVFPDSSLSRVSGMKQLSNLKLPIDTHIRLHFGEFAYSIGGYDPRMITCCTDELNHLVTAPNITMTSPGGVKVYPRLDSLLINPIMEEFIGGWNTSQKTNFSIMYNFNNVNSSGISPSSTCQINLALSEGLLNNIGKFANDTGVIPKEGYGLDYQTGDLVEYPGVTTYYMIPYSGNINPYPFLLEIDGLLSIDNSADITIASYDKDKKLIECVDYDYWYTSAYRAIHPDAAYYSVSCRDNSDKKHFIKEISSIYTLPGKKHYNGYYLNFPRKDPNNYAVVQSKLFHYFSGKPINVFIDFVYKATDEIGEYCLFSNQNSIDQCGFAITVENYLDNNNTLQTRYKLYVNNVVKVMGNMPRPVGNDVVMDFLSIGLQTSLEKENQVNYSVYCLQANGMQHRSGKLSMSNVDNSQASFIDLGSPIDFTSKIDKPHLGIMYADNLNLGNDVLKPFVGKILRFSIGRASFLGEMLANAPVFVLDHGFIYKKQMQLATIPHVSLFNTDPNVFPGVIGKSPDTSRYIPLRITDFHITTNKLLSYSDLVGETISVNGESITYFGGNNNVVFNTANANTPYPVYNNTVLENILWFDKLGVSTNVNRSKLKFSNLPNLNVLKGFITQPQSEYVGTFDAFVGSLDAHYKIINDSKVTQLTSGFSNISNKSKTNKLTINLDGNVIIPNGYNNVCPDDSSSNSVLRPFANANVDGLVINVDSKNGYKSTILNSIIHSSNIKQLTINRINCSGTVDENSNARRQVLMIIRPAYQAKQLIRLTINEDKGTNGDAYNTYYQGKIEPATQKSPAYISSVITKSFDNINYATGVIGGTETTNPGRSFRDNNVLENIIGLVVASNLGYPDDIYYGSGSITNLKRICTSVYFLPNQMAITSFFDTQMSGQGMQNLTWDGVFNYNEEICIFTSFKPTYTLLTADNTLCYQSEVYDYDREDKLVVTVSPGCRPELFTPRNTTVTNNDCSTIYNLKRAIYQKGSSTFPVGDAIRISKYNKSNNTTTQYIPSISMLVNRTFKYGISFRLNPLPNYITYRAVLLDTVKWDNSNPPKPLTGFRVVYDRTSNMDGTITQQITGTLYIDGQTISTVVMNDFSSILSQPNKMTIGNGGMLGLMVTFADSPDDKTKGKFSIVLSGTIQVSDTNVVFPAAVVSSAGIWTGTHGFGEVKVYGQSDAVGVELFGIYRIGFSEKDSNYQSTMQNYYLINNVNVNNDDARVNLPSITANKTVLDSDFIDINGANKTLPKNFIAGDWQYCNVRNRDLENFSEVSPACEFIIIGVNSAFNKLQIMKFLDNNGKSIDNPVTMTDINGDLRTLNITSFLNHQIEIRSQSTTHDLNKFYDNEMLTYTTAVTGNGWQKLNQLNAIFDTKVMFAAPFLEFSFIGPFTVYPQVPIKIDFYSTNTVTGTPLLSQSMTLTTSQPNNIISCFNYDGPHGGNGQLAIRVTVNPSLAGSVKIRRITLPDLQYVAFVDQIDMSKVNNNPNLTADELIDIVGDKKLIHLNSFSGCFSSIMPGFRLLGVEMDKASIMKQKWGKRVEDDMLYQLNKG